VRPTSSPRGALLSHPPSLNVTHETFATSTTPGTNAIAMVVHRLALECWDAADQPIPMDRARIAFVRAASRCALRVANETMDDGPYAEQVHDLNQRYGTRADLCDSGNHAVRFRDATSIWPSSLHFNLKGLSDHGLGRPDQGTNPFFGTAFHVDPEALQTAVGGANLSIEKAGLVSWTAFHQTAATVRTLTDAVTCLQRVLSRQPLL
jgi:hypothetical protein